MFRMIFRIFSFLSLISICALLGQDSIIFPHDYHIEEEELECTACHLDVQTSKTLTNSLLPVMDVCGDCHDVEDDCEMCHSSPDEADTYPVSGSTSGKDFSHNFHLGVITDCSRCHNTIIDDDGTSPRPEWQQWKCSVCHQQNKPGDHTVSWKQFHGLSVKSTDDPRCSTCHTDYFCQTCHTRSQFEPRTHDPDILYSHGLEARVEVIECSTCHQIDNDCRKCHEQQMILPMDHNQIQWVDTNNGGLHGSEALNQPERCQVCHSTYSCERCHGGNE